MIKTTLFEALRVSTHAMIMSDQNKLISRPSHNGSQFVTVETVEFPGYLWKYIFKDQEIEINRFGVATVKYESDIISKISKNIFYTAEVMFVIRTEHAVEEKDFEKQRKGNEYG